MNISRRQLYAAGEPLGDSVTRIEGNRRILGGGGGGQSGVYYKNQDKLLGVQADIASNMYNQYAEYAPTYMANSMGMVDEANSGALAERMRGRAAADSASAAAMEREATSRQMASMGINPNDPRFASGLRTVELGNAAQRASAMNNANWQAEDQRWNRNANAYGQIAGMGAGAMQGMSSAASGYGSMASSLGNNAAQNADQKRRHALVGRGRAAFARFGGQPFGPDLFLFGGRRHVPGDVPASGWPFDDAAGGDRARGRAP